MRAMDVRIGTSGYSYPPWKGSFYPEDLPNARMLSYYGERFSTVEINNTFYRMPTAKILAQWASQVPAGFRFALKASQRITHQKRLKDAGETVEYFFRTAAELGERRGPTLIQLPPNFKKDVPRLESFLALLPRDARAAVEFRHESWFDDEVWAALRAGGAALCVAESDELATPMVATCDFGYLRLRRAAYDQAALADWAERISAQPWREAYVYFKHEEEGMGPKLAAQLSNLIRSNPDR